MHGTARVHTIPLLPLRAQQLKQYGACPIMVWDTLAPVSSMSYIPSLTWITSGLSFAPGRIKCYTCFLLMNQVSIRCVDSKHIDHISLRQHTL